MITFLIAFSTLGMLYGRGLFPSTKITCIILMAICVGAYADSWAALLAALPGVAVLLKPGAGNRYMAFVGTDTRDYKENAWICRITDYILRTKPYMQLGAEGCRRWGATYAGLQGLAIFPLLLVISQGSWISIPLGLAGALQGMVWYAQRFLPQNETYGGMSADFFSRMIFAILIVLAFS